MKLSFNNINKQYAGLSVIDDFNYEVKEGELIALVGPSGCGKSTLLHIAAGLEQTSLGSVLADGLTVDSPSPERILMFQENALYPWLTLEQNVTFPLVLKKFQKREAREQAHYWLEKVDLKGFENYYPHQVSGGMRQRAALARAFISQPKVLLLDEPFGAVDALTRMTLQHALLDLLREKQLTVLLVTHDVEEALLLANRILIFSPRPARILKEFNLHHYVKNHDLSQYSAIRREILALLGISAEQEEFFRRNEEVTI